MTRAQLIDAETTAIAAKLSGRANNEDELYHPPQPVVEALVHHTRFMMAILPIHGVEGVALVVGLAAFEAGVAYGKLMATAQSEDI
jgi:hypothetical protein